MQVEKEATRRARRWRRAEPLVRMPTEKRAVPSIPTRAKAADQDGAW